MGLQEYVAAAAAAAAAAYKLPKARPTGEGGVPNNTKMFIHSFGLLLLLQLALWKMKRMLSVH